MSLGIRRGQGRRGVGLLGYDEAHRPCDPLFTLRQCIAAYVMAREPPQFRQQALQYHVAGIAQGPKFRQVGVQRKIRVALLKGFEELAEKRVGQLRSEQRR